MSWCKVCHCQIDRDDYSTSDGVCGSCIRNMKQPESFYVKHKNVCNSCEAIIDENWSQCCHCGGSKKYQTGQRGNERFNIRVDIFNTDLADNLSGMEIFPQLGIGCGKKSRQNANGGVLTANPCG